MMEQIQRQRRRFNRSFEVLNDLPMPEVSCNALVDLHNDVGEYDVTTVKFIQQWGDSPPYPLLEDEDLSTALSSFKARSSVEVESRRALLFYKRKVDTLIKDYNRLADLLREDPASRLPSP